MARRISTSNRYQLVDKVWHCHGDPASVSDGVLEVQEGETQILLVPVASIKMVHMDHGAIGAPVLSVYLPGHTLKYRSTKARALMEQIGDAMANAAKVIANETA